MSPFFFDMSPFIFKFSFDIFDLNFCLSGIVCLSRWMIIPVFEVSVVMFWFTIGSAFPRVTVYFKTKHCIET